jgi:hypothetical protein
MYFTYAIDINLWKIPSGDLYCSLKGHRGIIDSVEIFKNLGLIVSVSPEDKLLIVWDYYKCKIEEIVYFGETI